MKKNFDQRKEKENIYIAHHPHIYSIIRIAAAIRKQQQQQQRKSVILFIYFSYFVLVFFCLSKWLVFFGLFFIILVVCVCVYVAVLILRIFFCHRDNKRNIIVGFQPAQSTLSYGTKKKRKPE